MKVVNGYTIRPGADLAGASLRGAHLVWANLAGATLTGANLDGADLRGADLRGADLAGAKLGDAILASTILRGAILIGADLRDADLTHADLTRTRLNGAHMNWYSHDLIAERLRRAADMSVERRMVAGLILVSRDWCWGRLSEIYDPERTWALKTMAGWATAKSPAPGQLTEALKGIKQ